MNIKSIKGIFSAAYKAGDAVLLNGLHGIGKTDIVKDWAKENDFHLEILYLSTQQVSDLIGIPEVKDVFNGDNITIWTIPSWLGNLRMASVQGKKTVLMLDEFSRASLSVRQAALQLILDRKIHQHKLPELFGNQTLIIAAINPDNGYYAVESLDPALLDRFLTINVEVDVNSWLEWAQENKVNKLVTNFISSNPEFLHYIPETKSNETLGATPRSWAKLAKFIDDIDSIPQELHYAIVCGKVGSVIAPLFLEFMHDYYESMVSIKDIEIEAIKGLKHTKSYEQTGKIIAQLTKKLSSSEILELSNILIKKYIEKTNVEDRAIMLAMLYSLEKKLLAQLLETYQKSNPFEYSKIIKTDEMLNHRQLLSKS